MLQALKSDSCFLYAMLQGEEVLIEICFSAYEGNYQI